MVKPKKHIQTTVRKKKKENLEKLYLNYIDALVKSENLQNSLERTCAMLISSPSSIISKQTENLNNNLNNLLVKVMLLQNTINYLSSSEQ